MAVSAVTGSPTQQTTETTPAIDAANLVDFQQFLDLFVAQLRYQDPMSPMQGEDFLAQTAQFSSVEQLVNLNSKMSDMTSAFSSSSRSTAAALIGRSVTASVTDEDGNEVQVAGKVVQIDFDSGGDVVLGLEDGTKVAYSDLIAVSET